MHQPLPHHQLPSPRTLRSTKALIRAGLADAAQSNALEKVQENYAVAVSPTVLQAMHSSCTSSDPVARQYLPSVQELVRTPQELADPIADHAHSPVPGLVHRYQDRALLKLLHACAVYCRFCFRREQVGPGGAVLSRSDYAQALAYIRDHPAIREIILTGGDPLLLPPRRLAAVLEDLDAIPSLRLLRLHSRIPVAAVEHVGEDLLQVLRRPWRCPLTLVIHCNHAQELSAPVRRTLQALAATGISLRSQSVLLRGVNDQAAILEELFLELSALRVQPYYLHHPDLAAGTGHFRLGLAEGRAIYEELRRRISGLCLPRYVLDTPGGHGKIEVLSAAIRPLAPGHWSITCPDGVLIEYFDEPSPSRPSSPPTAPRD